MKKILLIICLLILLSGCYDYVEIEDTIIISGMIIDFKDEKYELISQVIDNNEKTKIKTYTTNGNSIEECLYKLSNISNKDIFISHLKTLILTDNTINKNNEYIDYFLRNTKSKMNFHVYYINNENKNKLLNLYKSESGSAIYLNELIDFNDKVYSSSISLTFMDFVQKQKEYGIINVYPNITIDTNNEEEILTLDGLVVFDKDNKIYLDQNESIFFNMITNNLNKTLINIPCDNNYFSLTINDNSSKFKINNSEINIHISSKGKINNYNCTYKLNDNKTINKLSNLTEKYINNELNNLISKSKKYNIDYIGLQNYIYKHNYKNYKKYNLNDIKININSKIIIDSIGEMNK